MNLKISKLVLALSMVSLTGFSQSGNFSIEGKVNRKHDGKLIKIYYEDARTKKGDSVTVTKGKFKLAGNITAPTVGKLSFGDRNYGDAVNIFLSEGKIRVSAKDSIHYSNVSGTTLAVEHAELVKRIRPLDDGFYNGIAAWKEMPEGEQKKAFLTNLMSGLDRYVTTRKAVIHQFLKEYPSSYVSLYYLNYNAQGNAINYEAFYPFYSLLSGELKATPLGKSLGERLLAVKSKLTGEQFVDFVSTTPDGEQLSLKEVIGNNKYTLVDFWASWCGPCRIENPNVVKTFNDFKEKGFTVFSVSLDENAEKWKAAIEKDGMPWYHVSSLKGWKEPAAVLYNIRAIPQNVLVDSKGVVVATNLRAETLYNKIQELTK